MGGQDRTAASIANGQYGIATREQLLSAGVSRGSIAKRLDKGALIRVYPVVYRVGHIAPSVEADYLAAVFACGARAVLYRRAAAHLLGLTRGIPAPEPEVLTPTERRIEGLSTHRTRSLDPRDTMTFRVIPVTTPARTLVDLAAVVHPGELARAVHEAGIRFDVTPDEIEDVLSRRPNATGAAKLRRVIHGDTGITLSRLERAFLKVLRSAGLPLPVTNTLAGGRLVDCRWAKHQLTVELDGYRFHRSCHAWEQDRQRERQAYSRGDQFRRYTWGDVTERSRIIVQELAAVLS
ncbi:MAG: hypothetical protein QOJ29_1433 [Thermoleophilaceae bacterium]|jgi:hypothetical protein|nr:hypothetical protein [Thermoleophilaceae bacterium]